MALRVYILICADNSYYTGVAEDLDYRFRQHETGFFLIVVLILVALCSWFGVSVLKIILKP